MSPKSFLEASLGNIKETLEEALRYDYGPTGSKRFFDECHARHSTLVSLLNKLSDSQTQELSDLGFWISSLSDLVHKIERANETELSWPLVEETRRLAERFLLEEFSTASLGESPIIQVYAEGRLDSYGLIPEDSTQNPYVRQPIHLIIFPRILKHNVLLHGVFAHEIGHAALYTSRLANIIRTRIFRAIVNGTDLQDVTAFGKWYALTFGPPVPPSSQLQEMLDSWTEEIFCDLFGAKCFGPAFFWAFKTLLCAIDPVGTIPGIDHPPTLMRVEVLRLAWKLLGWSDPRRYAANASPQSKQFALGPFADVSSPPWAGSLIVETNVNNALNELRALETGCEEMPCPTSDSADVELLATKLAALSPPCGSMPGPDGLPQNRRVDFRLILSAGWYVWATGISNAWNLKEGALANRFRVLNKLCEMGIAHQLAINKFLPAP